MRFRPCLEVLGERVQPDATPLGEPTAGDPILLDPNLPPAPTPKPLPPLAPGGLLPPIGPPVLPPIGPPVLPPPGG
jgi:hypothetical protein